MKKNILLFGLSFLMTLFLASCGSKTYNSDDIVCSIVNDTQYTFTIEAGQVLIKADGSYDWDSIGTPKNKTPYRNKFLKLTDIAPSQKINLYESPAEGYDYFVWGCSTDYKYVAGAGIPKDSKLIHIAILNGNLVIRN